MTKKLFIFSMLTFILTAIAAQGIRSNTNDLQNTTHYPNLQVPVSQTLPAATVINNGTAAQTNIMLSVAINGVAAGSSAPLASLAPGATAELELSQAVHFNAGQNTITYTISQDEIDENPADNIYTFTVTGTNNLFINDAATTASYPFQVTSVSRYGNIFNITKTTTINQVIAGFSTTTTINFNIEIYEMIDEITTDATPLFSQPATKVGSGFQFFDVPPTELNPGRYFLCISQLTATTPSLYHDGNTSRSLYRMVNNILTPQTNYGAAAIRMVSDDGACDAPFNLAVTPNYASASFSWIGDALRYKVVVTNDNETFSQTTTNMNVIVTGLTMGETYNWRVISLCDGVNKDSIAGEPFTTRSCETVSSFPLAEGFELNGTSIPSCWTNERITGSADWTVVTGNTGVPATAHSGAYKIRFFSTTKGSSARLVFPQMDLTSLSEPVLNFWHTQEKWGADHDTLKIYYKTSANGEWIHLITYSDDITTWRKDQIELPDASNDYYLAFVGKSQYGRGVQIDDIQICNIDDTTDGHDLQNITYYPYSQVPVTQTLPAGVVKNVGFATETNVILTVDINGNTAGTSAPLATIAPNATATLATSETVFVPEGQNTVTYTFTQDQTDDTPENNAKAFAFKGTQNIFAIDEVVECDNFTGNMSPVTFGLVYTINQPVTLSQVVVGHGYGKQLEYSVSLYEMIDETTTAATPIFTQMTTRNAIGFNFITVPATELTAGNYFLCINQLTNEHIAVSHDEVLTKKTYLRANNGTIQPTVAPIGAVALRMVMEVENCTAQQPTNLTVDTDYMSAVLSWEGTTPLYFLITFNDGVNTQTFVTTNNSYTINGLQVGAPYTWKVAAMCDATHGVETPENSFSTLSCDIINDFPYQESFENNGTQFATCWFQEQIIETDNWTVVAATSGTPATAQDGAYKATFASSTRYASTRLMMPPMDITELNNPVLHFWHTQARIGVAQDTLKVYYKSDYNAEWTLLATFDEAIADWQEEQIELPNASSHYYISFVASRPNYTNGASVQLDNIRVFDFTQIIDGELAEIIAPQAGVNYSLTNSEPVKVLITNRGSEALSNFDLTLELNGETIATETFTSSINSDETEEFTFAATLDLSAETAYEITVTAIVADDILPDNNSKTITVNNIICTTVTTFPFTESFEGDVFPPICWHTYNLGGGTRMWEQSSVYKHTGNFAASHDFSTITPIGWMVTPAIEIPTTGNYLLEFWSLNRWHADNFYSGVWISTNGGDPATATFTEIKQLKNDEISPYWKQITIPLSENFAGETIHIGFKYTGSNADNWFVDDVEIYNFNGFIDGELAEIITPNSGEGKTANEPVKVLVKNHSSDALSTFTLKLELNGVVMATETYSGSVASMSELEYTFNTTLDLSAIKTYEIKVTINVADDEDPTNDSKTKKFANFSSEVVELLAYRIFDEIESASPYGFISFKSNNPEKVNRINDYVSQSPASSIFAGEYVEGIFYAFTVTSEGAPTHFEAIATETWTNVATEVVYEIPVDMAYDYTTHTMYGAQRVNGYETKLVTIDLKTGTLTTVGVFDRGAYAMACSPEGTLYIVDLNGYLCTVNKTTGAATLVGSTGISPKYIQTMAFDRNTGRLFWAMCNIHDEGILVELDPATGVAFHRGAIAGNAELIGLYTIVEEVGIPEITTQTLNFNIYPNPVNDVLHVETLHAQTANNTMRIEIYSNTGALIQMFEMNDTKCAVNVSNYSVGTYFIRLTNGKQTASKSFIKR